MSMCANVARRGLTLAALVLVIGCNSFRMDPPPEKGEPHADAASVLPAAPSKYSFRIAPYVFSSDFDVPRDQPLFQELAGMRDQIDKELQLPTGNAVVQVYLFEDHDRYERFMKARYPDLPNRRAFFIAQPRKLGGAEDLVVYTFWDDRTERVRQDLRHELTHALLHGVIRDVPLWLDEGLAEYFELPPDRNGLNAAHLESLRHGAFGEPYKPDLSRLEGLTEVTQMTTAEYREAWAWVHLMLRDRPEAKAVLTDYLRQLRTNAAPGPLAPKLAAVYPSLDDAFEKHLAGLEASPRPERAEH